MLILLALLRLDWLISSQHWKRQLLTPVSISLVVYLVATSGPMVALATQALVASLPADSGTTADAIVVLGRGVEFRNSRIKTAVQLWQAKRAPKIFASGMSDAPEMIQLFKAKGIPGQMLGGESCSQTTEENALFTASVLHSQGIRQILLITDSPHMLRSFLTFRSLGFKVIPHTSPLPLYWTSTEEARFVVREYLGLVGYTFLGRFQQRLPSKPTFGLDCHIWYFPRN